MSLLQTTPQYCSDGYGFQEYILDARFIDAFACFTSDQVGGFVVVATLVFGAIALSLYIRTGSLVLPGILTLLTGGAILSTVAVPALAIATIAILTLGASVIAFAYWRYAR